jgi:NAD(P)-dependent dehydrogenase (short-subunit alcohol dehydrogenase family)
MSDATETTDCTLNAFISYSRHDAAIADTLVDALTALGFKVSIDRRSLPFGEKWQAELTDLIRLADTVVWLVSECSVQSTWVNWELDEVARWSKRLVPIMVGETPRDRLPRQLGEIHILPAQGVFEIDRDLSLLQRVLESDHEWLKEYTRLADRAFEWSAKGSALLLRGNALRLAERWRDQRPVKAPAPSTDVLDLILASRRASNQRQRWWTAGSLLVTAAATALAAFAYWQSQIAQANERRAIEQGNLAVRRYNAAKQAADSMTMNLARDLRAKESIPQQTVEVLLKAADEVMTRLISDSANDPELRLSHATMLEQYGEVFWLRGDATTAKDYSERCLDDIRIVEQGVERPAERVDITVTRH